MWQDIEQMIPGVLYSAAAIISVGLALKRSTRDMLRLGVAGMSMGLIVYHYGITENLGSGTTKLVTVVTAGYADLILRFVHENLPKYLSKKFEDGIHTDHPDAPGAGGDVGPGR